LTGSAETPVSFSFATVMKAGIVSVPAADVVNGKALYPSAGLVGTVTLRNGYHVGDIVVAAPSATAPNGVWAKLASVKSTSGGSTTFKTSLPKVDEVFSRGEFSTTLRSPVVLDANNAPALSRTNAATRTQSMGDILNPFSKNLSCGASASLDFDAKVGGSVSTELSAKWGFRPSSNYLKAGATVKVEASTSAAVSGDASCTLAKTDVLATPVNLPMLFIPLGFVQIPVANSLQFTLEGQAKSHASLATSASAKVEASVQGTLSTSGLATSHSGPSVTSSFDPPRLTVNGEAGFYLGARVDMKVGGLAGPYVMAAVGPRLTADINANPWWSIDGNFKAGVGIDPGAFAHLGLSKKEKDDIISKSWNISKARGGLTKPKPDPEGNGGTGNGDGIGDGSPGVAALRSIATYNVGSDLKCSLFTREDSKGEFFNNNACGTFISVGGVLFGPTNVPAASAASPQAYYKLVSQNVTGTGTAANPKSVVTIVDVGTTGIRLTQTDTWVTTSNVISTKISLQNRGTSSRGVRVYRGFDCYLGDSDTGTGELNVPGQLSGCLRSTRNGEVVTLRLQALTAGATVTEASYYGMWSQIGAQGDLNNGCRCFDDIDNAVATAWHKTLPAGQSLNLLSEISLRRPSEH